MALEEESKSFSSIEEIGKDTVDSIADDPFYTYGWFRTLETQKSYEISPLYFAACSEGKVKAIAPCFIRPNLHPAFLPLKISERIGFARNCRLIVGSTLCRHSKILLAKNSNNTEKLLSLLSSQIDLVCRKQKILISYLPVVSESDRLLVKNLPKLGYVRGENIPSYYLDIEWNDFEGYLESLEYKTRKNVRREIKKFKENGLTAAELEMSNHSTEISELYNNLLSKHERNPTKSIDSYLLDRLHEHANDRMKIFVAKKKDKTVGFSITLEHRNVLDVWITGFDYALQTKTDFAYFHVGYYAPINYAIEKRLRRIHYSATCDEIKIARGCKPEKTYFFAKSHNRLIRPFMSTAIRLRSGLT